MECGSAVETVQPGGDGVTRFVARRSLLPVHVETVRGRGRWLYVLCLAAALAAIQPRPAAAAGSGEIVGAATQSAGTAPLERLEFGEPVPEYILLVGNSMVRGIKGPLRKLFKAGGHPVRIKTLGRGGFSLEQHAASVRTAKRIAAFPWDYVFLQEQSDGLGEASFPFAAALHAQIVTHGSATALLMTWRDRGIGPEWYDSLHGYPGGTYGYVALAFELDVPTAPVGWAICEVVKDGPPVDLWGHSGRHLNYSGRYLAAYVLYATIFRGSPVGLPAPGRLGPAVAQYLQQIAADTVLLDPTEWNIPE